MACKWVRFTYRLLPLPAWRAFLLDRHIDRCPQCQAQTLGAEAIRSLGITPDRLRAEPPLLPFAAECTLSRTPARRRAWRYAFGFFFAVALLFFGDRSLPPCAACRPGSGDRD